MAVKRLFTTALAIMLAVAICGNAPITGAAPQQTRDPRLASFLAAVWPQAKQAGVSRGVFDSATEGLTLDPTLRGAGAKQSEFERPLKAYIAAAASEARAARARMAAAPWTKTLQDIEAAYGVPREVLLAVWGMESDFGRDQGTKDVIRSLATLAVLQPDRDLFRQEFIAALVILEKGLAARSRLKGSWAGAMGQPQFMPSVYLTNAVDIGGGGRPDIWTSVPDSLASIAQFLRNSGWDRHQSWGAEVRVPADFDFPVLRQDIGAWSRQGFAGIDGAAPHGRGEAMLFLPAGAGGPAFLLSPNFFVLKSYNFSDAYALAVAILADRIAGRAGPRAPWPEDGAQLSRTDRALLQGELAKRGFYKGEADGRIGPLTREAVHAFQRAAGLSPADGFPSKEVLAKLLQSPR